MKLKQTDLFNAAGTGGGGGGGQAKAQPTMLTADQAQKIANEAAAKAVRDMIPATQQQTTQRPDKAPVAQTASKAECATPKNPSSDLGWAWRIASILCLVILILAMIVLGKLAFSGWDSGVKNLSLGSEIPKAGHVEEKSVVVNHSNRSGVKTTSGLDLDGKRVVFGNTPGDITVGITDSNGKRVERKMSVAEAEAHQRQQTQKGVDWSWRKSKMFDPKGREMPGPVQ